MAEVFHPGRPRQINSRYLDEEGVGGGNTPAVITTGTINMVYQDNSPAGTVTVRRFVNNDGTTSAMFDLNFINTPGANDAFSSTPGGAQPLLAGLTAVQTNFHFSLWTTATSHMACYIALLANGSFSGQMQFLGGASGATVTTSFYIRY